MPGKCFLGIDIGTTSVKVCVIDAETKEVVGSQKKDTCSDVPSELGSDGNKQDVPRILSALQMCISRLPKEHMKKVIRMGVCGQMHGCMLWKHGAAWEKKAGSDRYDVKDVSHMYTWQDSRCSEEFLSQLPTPSSHLALASGYGCATLVWFCKNQPDKFSKYDRAGTIHDFFVSMICDLDTVVMSVQNAAAWGYLDTEKEEWNYEQLGECGLSLELLPKIVSSGQAAGQLRASWYGIPEGTTVLASLGDMQCSVLPVLNTPSDAAINISTSAQLCFVLPQGFKPPSTPPPTPQPVEYIPFFNHSYLAVAASLNGGNTLANFVRMLQQWVLELGFQVPQSKIWERILNLGGGEDSANGPIIQPTIYGERHCPAGAASVSDVGVGNTSLGKIMRSLCRGIITNIASMMPRSVLKENGITQIVGGGAALSRNPILQEELKDIYELPVTLDSRGDAAYGAALAALNASI